MSREYFIGGEIKPEYRGELALIVFKKVLGEFL